MAAIIGGQTFDTRSAETDLISDSMTAMTGILSEVMGATLHVKSSLDTLVVEVPLQRQIDDKRFVVTDWTFITILEMTEIL